MAQASDTVETARALLQERRGELQQELRQIEKALAELGGSRKRGPGRPPGSGSRGGPGAPRRRRRRGGSRSDQAVKLIGESPGIGVAELGKKMNLKAPNYLYRVLPDLEKDGRVVKKGRGYYPAA